MNNPPSAWLRPARAAAAPHGLSRRFSPQPPWTRLSRRQSRMKRRRLLRAQVPGGAAVVGQRRKRSRRHSRPRTNRRTRRTRYVLAQLMSSPPSVWPHPVRAVAVRHSLSRRFSRPQPRTKRRRLLLRVRVPGGAAVVGQRRKRSRRHSRSRTNRRTRRTRYVLAQRMSSPPSVWPRPVRAVAVRHGLSRRFSRPQPRTKRRRTLLRAQAPDSAAVDRPRRGLL